MDELERGLREALERQPAPPDLKRKVMERRWRQRAERRNARMAWLQRIAASVVLAGAVGGALAWRNAEERRKGEEVKQQVFAALRITHRALQQMNAQLKEQDKDKQ
ncbi:MAG: hypothetical protein ABSF23_13510 [Terracidiphilus sp.]